MRKEIYNKVELEEVINNSKCFSEVLEKFKIPRRGGNYRTLHRYIYKYNIDTSHFSTPMRQKENLQNLHKLYTIPLNKILVLNSSYLNTHNLKHRLYKEGIKERKCELCTQTEE